MNLPWVKHPTDLYLTLRSVHPSYRGTLYTLFEVAGRAPEELGYLPAEFRSFLDLDRRTIERHIEALQDSGLLVPDLFGRFRVLPVVQTEQRFPTRTVASTVASTVAVTRATPPRERRPVENPHRPVDNSGLSELAEALQLPSMSSEATKSPIALGERSKALDEKEHDVRTSASLAFGENPLGSAWDVSDQVPRQVDDDQIRYLIAKLVATLPAWSKVLSDESDRRLLVHLHAQHRDALRLALEQERTQPKARNAAAWLSIRCTCRTSEREAS